MDLLDSYESSSCSDDDEKRAVLSGVVERCPLQNMQWVRNQPHVSGNWAGHVYCNVRVVITDDAIESSVNYVIRLAEKSGYSGKCALHEEFHLSLSRIFYLQGANLDSFVEALTRKFHQIPTIQPFPIAIICQRPVILHNDEDTRSFLVWPVQSQQLGILVDQIDSMMDLYGLPRFYDPPIFHVSIASFVPKLNNIVLKDSIGFNSIRTIVSSVTCKLGNKVHVIPL